MTSNIRGMSHGYGVRSIRTRAITSYAVAVSSWVGTNVLLLGRISAVYARLRWGRNAVWERLVSRYSEIYDIVPNGEVATASKWVAL